MKVLLLKKKKSHLRKLKLVLQIRITVKHDLNILCSTVYIWVICRIETIPVTPMIQFDIVPIHTPHEGAKTNRKTSGLCLCSALSLLHVTAF